MSTMTNLEQIERKTLDSERLSFDDGVYLYNSDNIFTIGRLANIVRERKNGNKTFFITNLHINYTNVCVNRCDFCAFSKDLNEKGAYTLTPQQIINIAKKKLPKGATEIHIVGGLHPDLKIDYYLKFLSGLKRLYPYIHLQALTAVEIEHIARISGMTIEETLKKLKEAGLGSIPGGGAEVFSERIRKKLCPKKISGSQWLDVLRTAHNLGIKSNATMLYGHIETPEEIIDHLIQLRNLQDETNGFMSFIPLSFHPENTKLKNLKAPGGLLDLKTIAISRLMLDNFDHVKSFWIMLGLKLAQLSLSFGADDIDGTVIEERITHSAGAKTPQAITKNELIQLIKEAGRIPVERDTLYNEIK